MIVRLSDLVWGVGSEARALLIHGLTSSAQVWWRVASSLADEGIEVTAIDLRGHGASPRTASYALEDLVADVEAYVRRMGPFDIVAGHSIGGTITTVADLGSAARLLVDPVIDTPDPDGFRSDVLAELGQAPDRIEADNPSWHPDDVFWKWRSATLVSEATLTRFLDRFLPTDVSAALAGLEGPCAMIVADPSRGGLVSDAARSVADRNPAVDVVDAPGIGHSVQREAPDLVVRAMLGLR